MRCLYCYRELENGEDDFHPNCSKQIFGGMIPPSLPYSENDLEDLAREVIRIRTAVTGVQVKLSLHLSGSRTKKEGRRFTIVGLWGGYILKPPTTVWRHLPEIEDLTMHLAQISGIATVPHSLIRMASGNRAYISKRVDRTPSGKLAMEDMCQLTGRLTEDKYHSSYEQIAKAILKYSSTPGLDVINFFELVLFSFLTGNADMHLKNFSLLEQPGIGMRLSPAYDLVNTALVNTADSEELALTLNGKKRKISKRDFVIAMGNFDIDEKQRQNVFKKMTDSVPLWMDFIDISFLNERDKNQYKQLISARIERLNS